MIEYKYQSGCKKYYSQVIGSTLSATKRSLMKSVMP